MNHSIYTADRATHLKVVLVATLTAIIVSAVSIGSSRLIAGGNTVVVTAGKPIVLTSSSTTLAR